MFKAIIIFLLCDLAAGYYFVSVNTTHMPHTLGNVLLVSFGLLVILGAFLWPFVVLAIRIMFFFSAFDLASNVSKIARRQAGE
jgi:hypothetical protein